jgi:hypothetical protein
MADKIIRFFHGAEANIQGKIDDGTIDESDFIVTSDTDTLVYIDENKTQKPLGNSKTKTEHEVNLGGTGIGGLTDGAEIPVGTTLDEFIAMLTQKAVAPTYTQPGVTCRVSSGNQAGNYEVGTEISTVIQGTYTKNDGGDLTTIEIKKGSESVLSQASSPVTTDTQTFTLGDETVSFTATATYTDGPVKNNNLGQPDATGQIKAGSKTSSAVNFVGKRNLFYGTGVGTAPTVTSENVRALSNKQLGPANGTSFNINVATGQQYVMIAYPSSLRDMTKCFYVEQNTDLVENFAKSTISVQGANGATGADYKVYVYQMAIPAAAGMTLQVQI